MALTLSLCVGAPVVAQSPANCPAAANAHSKTYYVTGDPGYWKLIKGSGKGANKNLVCFNSFREAEKAGYRRWQPVSGKNTRR